MKSRGAVLVTLLVAAGLAAALAAVWNQYRQTRRALAFWGAEDAQLIETAATVELFDVAGTVEGFDGSTGRTRDSSGTAAASGERSQPRDISRAPGLIHFRRSLLEDANFDWAADPAIDRNIGWEYTVRFSNNDRTVTVLLDLDRRIAAKESANSGTAALTAKTAQGLEQFIQEHLQRR